MFSKLLLFGLSFLMFGLAVLQIFLGYALAGRTGNQKRIYLADEPTKFWTIVSLPIIVGLVTFVVGMISVLRGNKK